MSKEKIHKDKEMRNVNLHPKRLKLVIKLALATGLKRSDIINLEWFQIDMQPG
ncbi:hypothetical protein PSI17_16420 [Xenorhabdus sp. IM139775]|nr:hypothetical protein [Xenorhabdus sp. IM139775]